MKKTEIAFLISVFSFATFFALVSIRETMRWMPVEASLARTAGGAAGQPREVDMDKLRRMLRRHDLSSHEAMYYKPLASPITGGAAAPDDAGKAEPTPPADQ